MHPIERLRMVARAEGAGPSALAAEAAGALAGFAGNPAALVTACRRLVDRQPSCGPVWWLAARVLAAADPLSEMFRAGDELAEDATPDVLAASLPDDAEVCAVGWPELAAAALSRRGDLAVTAVDSGGEGTALCRRLRRLDIDARSVADAAVGRAAASADLVLLEASALGYDGFVAASGSYAAAAVGRHVGVPVWLVAGTGRLLPDGLWKELRRRLPTLDPPGDHPEELVPLDLIDQMAGPDALESVDDALGRPTCPVAPELLRRRPGR